MAGRMSVKHASGCNKHAFYYIVEKLQAFEKDEPVYDPGKIDIHPGAKRPMSLADVICESCRQPFVTPEKSETEPGVADGVIDRRDLLRLRLQSKIRE